jgi:3-methyladenine DNA glycosylase AlkD
MTRDPSPSWTAGEIVEHLRALGSEGNRAGMARFGIKTATALGVGNTVLRQLARKVKRNHDRALALWATGIREARLLATFTDEPKKVTREQCLSWAADFDSWEVVDHGSDLFVETPFWRELIERFAADDREFVRRAAFAMLAWAAVHLKKEPDSTFAGYLPLIEAHSGDGRNFVKKAVNWALRQIGKRSVALHGPALKLAEKLAMSDDKTARWTGKDAVKELTDPKTVERLSSRAG